VRDNHPVRVLKTASKSVIENPKTRIQTTPTMTWETMTVIKIRGRDRLGVGSSSARWHAASQDISVEKLVNSPSTIENDVDAYLAF
jgi:hypothetical protein